MTELKIVFQNENFVVADKPAAFLTVPGRGGIKDPRPVLGWQLQELLKKKIFPVHRLDYGVSGLVLFALDSNAHKAANQWFEQRKIVKIYEAFSLANPNLKVQEKHLWKSKLVRGKKRVFEAPHGQESITEATYVEQKNNFSHWRLHPVTGKSHQLRFEMAKHGFPIIGDELYGSKEKWVEGIALRARELIFTQVDFEKWGLPPTIEVPSTF